MRRENPCWTVHRLFGLVLFLFITTGVTAAYAQEAVSCEATLAEAHAAYNVGRFQEAIDLASACMQQGTPTEEERQRALLMQSRATFISGRKEDAGVLLRTLLQAAPDLVLDAEQEIASFVALAEEIRSDLRSAPVPDTDTLGPAVASSEVIPIGESGGEAPVSLASDMLMEAHEAEVIPLPVGGRIAIQRQVEYPEEARANGTEGYVLVRFVVDTQGHVRDAKIMRGLGDGCDEAALQAIQRSRFTPGQHEGRAVPVKMLLSIPFFLPE